MKKRKIVIALICIIALCIVIPVGADVLPFTPKFTHPANDYSIEQQETITINDTVLTYSYTATNDVAATLNVVNDDDVQRTMHTCTDEAQTTYIFDAMGDIILVNKKDALQYSELAIDENTASKLAVEYLKEYKFDVDSRQIISCALGEWGGYDIAFQLGDDERIADMVVITLNGDGSFVDFVVQKRGINNIKEVDEEFFENQKNEYLTTRTDSGLIKETSVAYGRADNKIVATFSFVFENESGGIYTDFVSFAK